MELTEKVNLETGSGTEFFAHLSDLLCGYVALAVRDFQGLFPEIRLGYPRFPKTLRIHGMMVR
jgi:hypothetical protein